MSDDQGLAGRFDSGGPGRRGPRRPPVPVEVVEVTQLTHRMVSVLVAGDDLSAFANAGPASHVKVFFPVEGMTEFRPPVRTDDGMVWPEGPRPVLRTYTPRRYLEGKVELQFVLHGSGTAGTWAATAGGGERLALAGPGGRPMPPWSGRRMWIAGDESALPGMATILESLPRDAVAQVHVEVQGPDDEVELPAGPGVTVTWHHRSAEGWGEELLAASVEAGPGPQDVAWVACEAAAVRRIRRVLLGERGLPAGAVTTRGYWRLGISNHPDHDFGED